MLMKVVSTCISKFWICLEFKSNHINKQICMFMILRQLRVRTMIAGKLGLIWPRAASTLNPAAVVVNN